MFESYKIGILVDIQGDAFVQLERLSKVALSASDSFDRLTKSLGATDDALSAIASTSLLVSDSLDSIAGSAASASTGMDSALTSGRAMNRMMLNTERRATAAAASMERLGTASRGVGAAAIIPPVARAPVGTRAPSGGRGKEKHSAPYLGMAAGVAASFAGGVYQFNNVAEALARIQMTRDTKEGLPLYQAAMQKVYAKYGYAAHGNFDPFGEGMNKIVQLMPRFSPSRQVAMFQEIAPYAASEAMIKHIPFSEAMESFIEVMHMAGAYTPQKMRPLEDSILTMSKVTPMNLGRITNTLSYALPVATSLGISPSVVMMQMAAMMQAGIRNSKSGTWLADFYLNAMPQILGSGLFKNKNQVSALTKLGLLRGHQMQFLSKSGHLDPTKLLNILSSDRSHMSSTEFTSMIELAFGKQGSRAVAMLTEPFVMKNMAALVKMDRSSSAPEPQVMKKTPGGAWGNLLTQIKSLWMAAGSGSSGPFAGLENKLASWIHASLPWANRHPDLTASGLGLASAGGIYAMGKAWFNKELLGNLLFKEAPMKLADGLKIAGKGMLDLAERASKRLLPALRALADRAPTAAERLASLGGRLLGFSNIVADFLMLFGYSGGLSRKGDELYSGKQIAKFAGLEQAKNKAFLHSVAMPKSATARAQLQSVHDVIPFVQVHSHVHLDGQQVAEVVTRHQLNAGAPTGPSQYAPFSTMPYPQNPAPTGG